MRQLAPVASALPGYGTAALPLVEDMPGSFDSSFIVEQEPQWQSCGRWSGWAPVEVQSGFQWRGAASKLYAYVEPRLGAMGWSTIGREGAYCAIA